MITSTAIFDQQSVMSFIVFSTFANGDAYALILGKAIFNAILNVMVTLAISQELNTLNGIIILMTLLTTKGLSLGGI